MPIQPYRDMWLIVLYDLPTLTVKQRKAYTKFHGFLEKKMFSMFQFSVYVRYCGSRQQLEHYEQLVESQLPPEGKVTIFHLTDKQFGMIKTFYGKSPVQKPNNPQQLELF